MCGLDGGQIFDDDNAADVRDVNLTKVALS